MIPKNAIPSTKHTIPAVTKAMEVLRLLAETGGETSTNALARRLGIPRTSCYRILRSLIAGDWIRATPDGRHALSLGLWPLLASLRPAATLAAAVEPALQALAARIQLTAKVSVRQGDDAVTIARVASPRATSVVVRLGGTFPLVYGSSGTVLLSELGGDELDRILATAPPACWELQVPGDIRERLRQLRMHGWCADFGTFRPSCHAVSAPLRGIDGRIAASLTIIGFPDELPRDRVADLAAQVLEAVGQAEEALRGLGEVVDGLSEQGS